MIAFKRRTRPEPDWVTVPLRGPSPRGRQEGGWLGAARGRTLSRKVKALAGLVILEETFIHEAIDNRLFIERKATREN